MLSSNFMPYLIQYGAYSLLTIFFRVLFLCLYFGFPAIFLSTVFCGGFLVFPHHFTCSWRVEILLQLQPLKWNVLKPENSHVFSGAIFLSFLTSHEWMENGWQNSSAAHLLEKCGVNDIIYIHPIHFHRFLRSKWMVVFCCANGCAMLIYIQSKRWHDLLPFWKGTDSANEKCVWCMFERINDFATECDKL